MPKRIRHYSSETRRALSVLGDSIALERAQQRRSQADIAERSGISVATLGRIESGAPGSEVGSVLEVAAILGLRLFPDVDERLLHQRLLAAPRRIVEPTLAEGDDF